MSFTFVDLFAGIGGFHAALAGVGGEGVYASEIDAAAAAVYERNWGLRPDGDIVEATSDRMDVPKHDVLTAGFPCQPFSKSGYQRGMDEARGTLFWNICRVLEARKPSVIFLENVRNLAGPRHEHEWTVIVRSLRDLGYRVSGTPAVFSPHLLPPELGGSPQVRDRVFILGTYVGKRRAQPDVEPIVQPRPVDGWDPQQWDLERDLPLQRDRDIRDLTRHRLTGEEATWIAAWDDFVHRLRGDGLRRLPGFPIWADYFTHQRDLGIPKDTPKWKADFLRKNSELYTNHQRVIDDWLEGWNYLQDFPPSRRKLEWQAQDAESLWDTLMQFRPSGIRAKRPTYVPALVAITQTSIVGSRKRRLTPLEGARLQGLPDDFNFGDQPTSATYKQLGNGVNVGAVRYAFTRHVLRDAKDIAKRSPGLVDAVLASTPASLRDRYTA